MLPEDEKKKLLLRLRRVNGQVEAVSRMIDENEYCVEHPDAIVGGHRCAGKGRSDRARASSQDLCSRSDD